MLGKTIVCVMAGCLLAQVPKAPVVRYDHKRDVSTYSTGDVQTEGYSGYEAHYELPGKMPAVPGSISIGFGGLRLSDDDSQQDQALLHWNKVKTITLTHGGKAEEYPATHDFHVSKNSQVSFLLGRALEESLNITVTPAQLKELVASDSIQVHLGKDVQVLKGKSLSPLRKLAASIPSSAG